MWRQSANHSLSLRWHKRLHLESSKPNYYIISLRAIIKAIFTSHTHTYAHAYICTCMTLSTRRSTDTEIHNLFTNMHTHTHTHVYNRIDVQIHTHMHIYTYIHVRTHIHIHIYTHTHTKCTYEGTQARLEPQHSNERARSPCRRRKFCTSHSFDAIKPHFAPPIQGLHCTHFLKHQYPSTLPNIPQNS